jgi:hypothetical protein
MSLHEIQKVSFNQIIKSPPVYMLMVAVSLMWFFVYKFGGASDQVNKNCELENAHLREENAQIRKEKDDLTMALLVKNGIINEIKKATDSAANVNFGDAAKKVIKK